MDWLSLFGLSGITVILTRSTLFRAARRLAPHFLGCPMCVGWHVGFWAALGSAWLAGQNVATTVAVATLVARCVVVGGAVSLAASIGGGLLDRFFGPAVNEDAVDTEITLDMTPHVMSHNITPHSVFDPSAHLRGKNGDRP